MAELQEPISCSYCGEDADGTCSICDSDFCRECFEEHDKTEHGERI